MKHLVVVLVVAGCGESAEESLERFRAEADIECWQYFCDDGPGARFPLPSVPTEDGVACMNEALVTGARAIASWGDYDYNHYLTTTTYVFTVDGEVRVFTSQKIGPDPRDVSESPPCGGPFRVGAAICSAMVATPPYYVPVHALAWDGCP